MGDGDHGSDRTAMHIGPLKVALKLPLSQNTLMLLPQLIQSPVRPYNDYQVPQNEIKRGARSLNVGSARVYGEVACIPPCRWCNVTLQSS